MGSEPMNEEQMLQDKLLDERVIHSLERLPDVSELIPADFVARVAARIPAREPVSVKQTHYGLKAMLSCGVVLLVGLFGLTARGMDHSGIGLVVLWCLFSQFVALAIWLGTRCWGEG